jgi:beta-lactamase superfamily II metal-dependent hydrolase
VNKQIGKLKIAFLDVGQGDTIIVSDPNTHEAIVIDCTNANAVLDYLAQENVEYLRGILISHLHADHYSEVDYLLYRYSLVPGLSECERVGFSQITDKNKSKKFLSLLMQDKDEHSLCYEQLLETENWSRQATIRTIREWCKDDKTRFTNPQVDIKPDSLKFEGELAKRILLIHPYAFDIPDLQAKGLNNTSVVLHVIGTASSALLTGDLEPTGWKELCRNYSPANLQSDVLKFPHHGGAWKKDDIDDLLNIVNPSIVVISVGSKGYEQYTHPHPDVFEAIRRRENIHLLCTQATNQCLEHVMTQRDTIRDLLTVQASKSGQKLIGSKRGCPCAGTIVIELGESAQVIQPEPFFHQQTIIPHFENHQCRFGQGPTDKVSSSYKARSSTREE